MIKNVGIFTMQSQLLLDNLNERLFITADPQFGSHRLFKYIGERRRFGSMKSLHDSLVENWNASVRDDDVILCLGDFTQNMQNKKKSMKLIEKYTPRLNGRKLLIRGNHDVEDTCWYYDFGWTCLVEYPLIILDGRMEWLSVPSQYCGCIVADIAGRRILFSHFAIFEDDARDRRFIVEKAFLRKLFSDYRCNINIHGHTHLREVDDIRCHSACVEHLAFSPVRLGDFLQDRVPSVTGNAAKPLSLLA